ncbi:hypothetical protein CHCC20335_2558 [Bacillus paralicheniformis]|nr:hypothetical protein CHCC20335_2558 [Bacillus paralicheniformis]
MIRSFLFFRETSPRFFEMAFLPAFGILLLFCFLLEMESFFNKI